MSTHMSPEYQREYRTVQNTPKQKGRHNPALAALPRAGTLEQHFPAAG